MSRWRMWRHDVSPGKRPGRSGADDALAQSTGLDAPIVGVSQGRLRPSLALPEMESGKLNCHSSWPRSMTFAIRVARCRESGWLFEMGDSNEETDR
jgi:hypothetical protein